MFTKEQLGAMLIGKICRGCSHPYVPSDVRFEPYKHGIPVDGEAEPVVIEAQCSRCGRKYGYSELRISLSIA